MLFHCLPELIGAAAGDKIRLAVPMSPNCRRR